MKASIISIGNSKGIRIPKVLLEESGLKGEVDIRVTKKGEIKVIALDPPRKISDTALITERVLARDWLRPEEDEAWASLQ